MSFVARLVLVALLAAPLAARAEEDAAEVLARLLPGRLDPAPLALPSLGSPFAADDHEKGGQGPLTWGLLCPGGGQFANGDWFAGVGVLASVGLFAGTGTALLLMDRDLQMGPAVGLSFIGVGLLLWGLTALEASMGGACIGNCLGGCLTACGLAAVLPDGGGRRNVIQPSPGAPKPRQPSPQRPAPARPVPTTTPT